MYSCCKILLHKIYWYQKNEQICQNISYCAECNNKDFLIASFENNWEMSTTNVFLIAIIALITIVILFYTLERCAKFLESRNHQVNNYTFGV